jgi:protein-export membrane protein SecD
MLQFPAWKVFLIVATLAWGLMMALPNFVNTSNVPFAPDKGVNLGLDLQGGVYLLMEIDPDEVVGNRMAIFAGDVGGVLRERPIVAQRTNVEGRTLRVQLTNPDKPGEMEEALKRIAKLNEPIEGAIGGAKTYDVQQVGRDAIVIGVPAASEEAIMKDALGKTMTIVRRRVDPDGVSEISLTPQGVSRIVLEAPGEPDSERLKNILSRDGKMTFNMVDMSPSAIAQAQAGVPPSQYDLLDSLEQGPMLVKKIPEIDGSEIASASQGFDEGNRPQINFRLNSTGSKKFARTTAQNSGKFFGIVLDGVVMSAPRINEPIYGGNVRITGSFTMEEAQDLAAIISAGAMPAKVKFLDERTVSATLGEDSIKAGTRASIIGLVLVAVFMMLAYGLMGGFAVTSLAANIMLILGALSGLGATLTLPGIAGIILTIGMAVDANVLVFERIREEQHAGRSPVTAVQAGYERALSTILDANITTFIAAVVLYFMGSGPVQGFAATLAIGIVTSVFTAFVFTRWLTSMWLKTARPKKLAI